MKKHMSMSVKAFIKMLDTKKGSQQFLTGLPFFVICHSLLREFDVPVSMVHIKTLYFLH
ncbi:hypothetical protein [Lentibacillus sp. Marseille-P4043]|uniref:hypothetical protein n=1 Tax=Lentibacillus sp. Marseille-P4043 TaxID=2040293 RepID=UPI00131A4DA3|nr:hypothetical protein [Lentibacillus sp. Marseille-P4043]